MRRLLALWKGCFTRASGGHMPPSAVKGDSLQCIIRGRCPLDGYPLVEFLPGQDVPAGLEHIVPPEEGVRIVEAQRRIAEAHAFEAVTEAERITRESSR